MSVANLDNASTTIIAGNDAVVIPTCLEDIRGGKTLDCTDFTAAIIPSGYPIIKSSDGKYKPMPLAEGAIGTLPASHTYVGICKTSISTSKPFAAIMVRGTVNTSAVTYPLTSILAALKTALPLINFTSETNA